MWTPGTHRHTLVTPVVCVQFIPSSFTAGCWLHWRHLRVSTNKPTQTAIRDKKFKNSIPMNRCGSIWDVPDDALQPSRIFYLHAYSSVRWVNHAPALVCSVSVSKMPPKSSATIASQDKPLKQLPFHFLWGWKTEDWGIHNFSLQVPPSFSLHLLIILYKKKSFPSFNNVQL